MKQMINITTSIYDMDRYRDAAHLKEFYQRYGCDGYELMRCKPPCSDLLPKEDVVGVHLGYFTNWVDFWLEDEEALLAEYDTKEQYEAIYGGTSKERILEFFRDELEFADRMGAEYVVFHAGSSSSREVFTYQFTHPDELVVDALADIINQILDGTSYSFHFLVENLPWSGMRFTNPDVTRRLLEQIHYPKKGIMLDTGHLLCTNPDITTMEEGLTYIYQRLKEHGDLCDYIKGVHFHQTLSGPYVKSVLANQPVLPDNYQDRINMAYSHVFKIDEHRPFTAPGAKELIEFIHPEYLTYEFITCDLKQHEEFMEAQMAAMK